MENQIESDKALLENVMDALDRLFDGKSNIVDLQALLFATSQALPKSHVCELMNQANEDLKLIIQKVKNKESQKEYALNTTNPLRLKLSEILDA